MLHFFILNSRIDDCLIPNLHIFSRKYYFVGLNGMIPEHKKFRAIAKSQSKSVNHLFSSCKGNEVEFKWLFMCAPTMKSHTWHPCMRFTNICRFVYLTWCVCVFFLEQNVDIQYRCESQLVTSFFRFSADIMLWTW